MHQYKGYDYLVVQHDKLGHLCGYVKIPKTHKFHGKDYDDIDIDCHGGVTFSKHIDENSEMRASGFNEGYWIGWDYAHLGDRLFYSLTSNLGIPDKHWQIWEVEEECRKVIDQLIKAEK